MQEPLVYLNGLFWPLNMARVSVLDRGFNYGDGVFETLRCYYKKVYRLDEHLNRLLHSTNIIFLDLPMTKNEIKCAIYKTIEINSLSDSIIRLTITRGEQPSGININQELPPTVVILARPLSANLKQAYKNGIAVSLYKNSAFKLSGIPKQIKTCNYLSNIILRERALKDKSFEAIMLDHNDNITEGCTSNIFIVKNGEIKTPKVNEFVLDGITRHAIFDIAKINKILCREMTINVNDIYTADEVFISNTGIEILPVCKVNRQIIAKGKPGPITKYLHKMFLKSFEDSR